MHTKIDHSGVFATFFIREGFVAHRHFTGGLVHITFLIYICVYAIISKLSSTPSIPNYKSFWVIVDILKKNS